MRTFGIVNKNRPLFADFLPPKNIFWLFKEMLKIRDRAPLSIYKVVCKVDSSLYRRKYAKLRNIKQLFIHVVYVLASCSRYECPGGKRSENGK